MVDRTIFYFGASVEFQNIHGYKHLKLRKKIFLLFNIKLFIYMFRFISKYYQVMILTNSSKSIVPEPSRSIYGGKGNQREVSSK